MPCVLHSKNENQTIRYLPTGQPFRRSVDFALAFLPKAAIYYR